MAIFQVGDKVKFLNQTGGGVVTKVTDDFVFVEDESGFDMPMQPSELIRMADMSGAGKLFNQKVYGMDKVAENTQDPMAAKYGTPKQSEEDAETIIKRLQAQVGSLKEQVAQLKRQIATMQKQGTKELADNILLQHTVAEGEAVVDLHIDMISSRPGELLPHEAFEVQMHYFRTCMNHAFANKMKKVTFIHGVGKGILKDEIMKELRQYDNIAVMEASRQKYGVGAVDVFFGC